MFTTHIFLDSNGLSILRFAHMKHTGVSTYQLLLSVFAVTALSALFAVFPMKASALEVASQTQQILPPGVNTCTPLQVSNFTPYIYENGLDSFEFTVSDTSYVAVVGSVGNTSIPFRLMTRLQGPAGSIRVHVDVDSTPIKGSLPIAITLLSAKTGQPVCASVVAVSLGSGPVTQTPAPTQTPSYPTYVPPASAPSTVPAHSTPSTPSTAPTNSSSQGNVSTGTGVVVPPIVGGGIMKSPMERLCSSTTSAYRLWLVLLVLYAILVGGLLWLEFPMSWTWAQAPERVASAILVLLILLLGFWYFSIPCRAALWMPLVAFLIAILGLLAAFWNHPRMTQLLLIENTNL